MKKILNTENLSELSRETIAPAISIYFPLKISGKERAENRIRLENLLREAGRKLIKAGNGKDYARQLLEPAFQLAGDSLFWKKTAAAGLALFIMPPQIFRYFELPDPAVESIKIASGFRLDPLRKMLRENRDFFILKSSQNQLEFYKSDNGTLKKITVKGLPENVESLQADKKFEKHLESHGAAPHGKREIFHGHGGKKDAKKIMREKYFRQAAGALDKFLAQNREPLIFAGAASLYAEFREASSYQNLHPEYLPGNFEKTPLTELFKKASHLLKSAS